MNLAANVEIQNRGTGNRNVNCGSLRRIGKSTALREMIVSYKTDNPDHSIYLLVPVLSMAEQYRDLRRDHIIDEFISVRNFERNIRGRRAYIFSDEVVNAQQLAEQCQQSYIAGFYTDITRNRRLDHSFMDVSWVTQPSDPVVLNSNAEPRIDPKQRYKFIARKL